jgi:hypothetical protein
MNAEQFALHIKDESYLYSLNYEELKTLVMSYPYCQNFRVLLLKKSHIEKSKDFDRFLQTASTYSFDRHFLFKTVQRLQAVQAITKAENVILGEDYLILAELSKIEHLLSEKQMQDNMGELAPQLEDAQSIFSFIDESAADEVAYSTKDEIEKPTIESETFDLELGDQAQFTEETTTTATISSTHEILDFSNYEESNFSFDGLENEIRSVSEQPSVEQAIFIQNAVEKALKNLNLNIDALLEKENLTIEGLAVEKPRLNQEALLQNFEYLEKIPQNPAPSALTFQDFIEANNLHEPISPIEHISEKPLEDLLENAEKLPVQPETIQNNEIKKALDLEFEIQNATNVRFKGIEKSNLPQTTKVSFGEWLRQFKMESLEDFSVKAPAQKPIEQVVEEPETVVQKLEINQAPEPENNLSHTLEDDNDIYKRLLENTQALLNLPENTVGSDGDFDSDIQKLEKNADITKPKKKKKRLMHEFALKSINLEDDIVSETLAEILVAQDSKEKAAEMYGRLILKYPEKSAYFAAKIQALA